MKTMKQLLGNPPRAPISVAPNDSVIQALRVMAEQDIGAVVVMDDHKLIGIFMRTRLCTQGCAQGQELDRYQGRRGHDGESVLRLAGAQGRRGHGLDDRETHSPRAGTR